MVLQPVYDFYLSHTNHLK